MYSGPSPLMDGYSKLCQRSRTCSGNLWFRKESAKAFTDSLIISTDVDKPLATFRQIKAVLEDMSLTDKNRVDYAREIAEESITSLARPHRTKRIRESTGRDPLYQKGACG